MPSIYNMYSTMRSPTGSLCEVKFVTSFRRAQIDRPKTILVTGSNGLETDTNKFIYIAHRTEIIRNSKAVYVREHQHCLYMFKYSYFPARTASWSKSPQKLANNAVNSFFQHKTDFPLHKLDFKCSIYFAIMAYNT